MLTGPIIDSLATLGGAVAGTLLGKKIPERLRIMLPMTFGAASMALGMNSVVKVNLLPPVILALLVGSALGELLKIESGIERIALRINRPIQRIFPQERTAEETTIFLQNFVSILILFSASGTGIFGALNEGITHDPTLLISKGMLDFFTAAIFATSLGLIVATTVIPQFIILAGLYLLAKVILPLTTPELIADFTACGGILMFVTGFRICGIKKFPIANMLPALLLVMIFSHYWRVFF